MSTLPIPADISADTYTDFTGLQALKRAAAKNDPSAVRKVAQQFESMFTRMMLKSMRDAVGTDPIFGSDQEKTYQGMYDDQLALQLSKGRGLGLSDMLVRQLQRLGATGAGTGAGAGAAAAPDAGTASGTAGGSDSTGTGGSTGLKMPAASAATQQSFIRACGPRPSRPRSSLALIPPISSPSRRWRPTGAEVSPTTAAGIPATTCSASRPQRPGTAPVSRPKRRKSVTAAPAAPWQRSVRMRMPPRASRTMYRYCATTRVTPPRSTPELMRAPSRPGCNAVVMRPTRIMSARSAPSPTTSPATWPLPSVASQPSSLAPMCRQL